LKRSAALVKVTILAAALGSIALGGLAVYYYTLPPASASAGGTPPAAVGQVVTNQVSSGHYITVEYNGTSYSVPAKGANSPSFACPQGTDPSLCNLLHETCGNGVGAAQEPWKTCDNCVFDAGCAGDNSCDPYTHECSSPASACMVIAGGYNKAG
jgi:hypothetical protein